MNGAMKEATEGEARRDTWTEFRRGVMEEPWREHFPQWTSHIAEGF